MQAALENIQTSSWDAVDDATAVTRSAAFLVLAELSSYRFPSRQYRSHQM